MTYELTNILTGKVLCSAPVSQEAADKRNAELKAADSPDRWVRRNTQTVEDQIEQIYRSLFDLPFIGVDPEKFNRTPYLNHHHEHTKTI